MSIKHKNVQFKSLLGPVIQQLIREKRACGRKYKEAPRILECFDRFLCGTNIKQKELPKEIVLQWLTKRSD